MMRALVFLIVALALLAVQSARQALAEDLPPAGSPVVTAEVAGETVSVFVAIKEEEVRKAEDRFAAGEQALRVALNANECPPPEPREVRAAREAYEAALDELATAADALADPAAGPLEDLFDAEQALVEAREAARGPAPEDQSPEYEKQQHNLAEAEAKLAEIGDRVIRARARGVDVPDSTLDAYDRAKRDAEAARQALDDLPETRTFEEQLPELQAKAAEAEETYFRAVKAYLKALVDYELALDAARRAADRYAEAVREWAASCVEGLPSTDLPRPRIAPTGGAGNGPSDAGRPGAAASPAGGVGGSAGGSDEGPRTDGVRDDSSAPDNDADGVSDADETNTYGTDPTDPDSDHDGLFDGEEIDRFGTDPLDADTDGDLLDDGLELKTYLTDPFSADSDGDGLADADELADDEAGGAALGTNPLDPDSDRDGFADGVELEVGTDPLWAASYPGATDLPAAAPPTEDRPNHNDGDGAGASDLDRDGDGLTDDAEVDGYGTDPLNPDTDGDGASDWEELAVSLTDPLDATSNPWATEGAVG